MNRISIIQHENRCYGKISLGPFATFHQGNIVHVHQDAADTCLADLKVTNPRHDKNRIIESIDCQLLRETYSWVLDHPTHRQWRDMPENRLLWIKGDPGKGKTLLLCGMIEELEASNPDGRLLSYFFCQNSDGRLNTAINVLRGLIYMLAAYEPLVHHVKTPYNRDGKGLFEGANAWQALSDIFLDMVNDPNFPQAILVVDGLDECTTSPGSLVNLIARTQSSPRIKWIVSSRNLPEIEELLSVVPRQNTLSLEDNAEFVSSAVQVHIKHRADGLAKSKKYSNKLRKDVEEGLLSGAEGTFLWVALVCRQLALPRVTRRSTLSKLQSFPKGLEPFYNRMLGAIDATDDALLCKQILAVATISFRPLTLEELKLFLEDPMLFDRPSMIHDDDEEIEDVILRCGSFVAMRSGTCSLIHQSAKDFLLTTGSAKVFSLGQQAQHHAMYSRSMDVLSNSLRRDIYQLENSGIKIHQIEKPDPDPLVARRYICTNWFDHAYEGHNHSQIGLDCATKIGTFMEANYTHWLEALSLLGDLRRVISSLLKLRSMLEMHTESQVPELVDDAHRFLQSHIGLLEIHPLQVYVSALLFTPTQSIIRCRFHHQSPDCVEVKGCIEEQWNACLLTLEGHAGMVYCVAVEPGGKFLASASFDRRVRIWDAVTGFCLYTFVAHEYPVLSVAFVPGTNGKFVLSASVDKTIKLWNTITERCFTLTGHTDSVTSVVCGTNSAHGTIGSASSDSTVRIWDLRTGRCLQTLKGHTLGINSVAFVTESGDKEIASASKDGTVKIWDTVSGQCLRTLSGHTKTVNSVSSADGKIASASDDLSIKIWDKKTGACLRTIVDHTKAVKSVSFRSNGGILVSASKDMTVKIWNMESEKCMQTLTGHTSEVSSVVFSPNGRKVVSAAWDLTIKIWDAEKRQISKPCAGHSGDVFKIVFSPNGRQVASTSWTDVPKIWDAGTGMCLTTFKDSHMNDPFLALAYSPDGRHIVSASLKNEVKIWDAETGVCLQTIPDEIDWCVETITDKELTIEFDHKGRYLSRVGPPIDLPSPEPGRAVGKDPAHAPLPSKLSFPLKPGRYIGPTDTEMADSRESRWVRWEGKDLLQLPQRFQPCCSATYGSQMAVGCMSGDVLFLKIFEDRLHQLPGFF